VTRPALDGREQAGARSAALPSRAPHGRRSRAGRVCGLLLLGTLVLGGCHGTPSSIGAGESSFDPPRAVDPADIALPAEAMAARSDPKSGAPSPITPTSMPVPGAPPTIIDTRSVEPLNNLDRLAFPSAQGFGAHARGGRHGAVLYVSSLADHGPGSLRACVEAAGPRTCVFATGGTIVLGSVLSASNPFLTIAGQTAPGGGIQLMLSETDEGQVLAITTHDVVVRHLRLRRGATSLSAAPDGTCCGDAVVLTGAERVILDHVSVGFATDENVDVYGSRDVTVQDSIIAYGLRHSTHTDTAKDPEDHHSMGALVGAGSTRVSFIRNLFAFNLNRNPRLQSGISEVCGNLVYGATANPISLSGDARANVVGNHFDPGPENSYTYVMSTEDSAQAYAKGNTTPADIWELGANQASTPFQTPSCDDRRSLHAILSQAGAWPRDSLDSATVGHVHDGTGGLIDSPTEVDGWPQLEPGVPPHDVDGDGMADQWEREVGLNPDTPQDGNDDYFGVGYTALEVYLAWLAHDVEIDTTVSVPPISP
jgi:pectate lyase